MRRTLVGFIAALALGSVSPAAFAADMVPEPSGTPEARTQDFVAVRSTIQGCGP